MTSTKSRLLLYTVIILAALIRLIILVTAYNHPDRSLAPDSDGYIRPAMVLVNEGGYNDPSAIRTPGYPIFLAGIFATFGENYFAVVVCQILLNLLTLYVLYRTARLLLPEEEALLTVILFALALESILSAFFILTETLFAFLLAVVTWALVKYRQTHAWKWAALTGIVAGFAILTRPIAILYPAVIALVLLFGRTNWKTRLIHLTISLALTASVVAPWIIRNYNLLDVATLSTISGRYYLYYQAAFLIADQDNLPIEQAKQELRAQADEIMENQNIPEGEVNRNKVETALARQIILAQPIQYVGVHLREDAKNLLPGISILLNVFGVQEDRQNPLTVLKFQGIQAALENYFGDQTWLILLFIPYFIFLGVVYLGGALGAFVLIIRRQWFDALIILLPIVYYLGMPGGSSNARFRVPVMPHLCLLAAIGLIYLWRILSTRFKRTSS